MCFRAAWSKGEDPNEISGIAKKLWPIPVKDIDLKEGVMGDHKKEYRAFVLVNVASN